MSITLQEAYSQLQTLTANGRIATGQVRINRVSFD